jgi:hypothetical protein
MNRSLALARIQENLTGLIGGILPVMPEGGLERVASDLLRPGALSVVSGSSADVVKASAVNEVEPKSEE